MTHFSVPQNVEQIYFRVIYRSRVVTKSYVVQKWKCIDPIMEILNLDPFPERQND